MFRVEGLGFEGLGVQRSGFGGGTQTYRSLPKPMFIWTAFRVLFCVGGGGHAIFQGPQKGS